MAEGIDWFKMGKESMTAQLGGTTKGGRFSGLDKITRKLRAQEIAKETENKAIEKEKKTRRNIAGAKISNAFIEMGPELKALGQESYTQAQNEVEALRQEMFAAIDADDPKAIADINVRFNELKGRHSTDSENLTTLVESWENKDVSSDAMTDEHQKIMENFATNESKRVVYSDDQPPVMMYEWDVETGELDKYGEPIMETERYSLKEMQDMIIMKDNVNGLKLIDQVEAWKKMYAENKDSAPSDAAILAEIKKIIPQDAKQLRDWLHGNPAGADGLDVHSYLTDLLSVERNNVLAIQQVSGKNIEDIEDTSGPDGIPDGVKDAYDLTSDDKEEMIRRIMDVEDMELSHEIISEIYADISKNNMAGRSELNRDDRDDKDKTIMGSETNLDGLTKLDRDNKLANLQALSDKNSDIWKNLESLNELEIAKALGFKDLNAQIMFNGKLTSISSFIPVAGKAVVSNIKSR